MRLRMLVTGGPGYLGCVLTRHLHSREYQVTVLDNLIYHQNQIGLLQYCYHEYPRTNSGLRVGAILRCKMLR